jgi:hypothetical protein
MAITSPTLATASLRQAAGPGLPGGACHRLRGSDRRVVDLHGDEEPLSEVILGLLSHTARHLGMIEGLRGVAGDRGTATT